MSAAGDAAILPVVTNGVDLNRHARTCSGAGVKALAAETPRPQPGLVDLAGDSVLDQVYREGGDVIDAASTPSRTLLAPHARHERLRGMAGHTKRA